LADCARLGKKVLPLLDVGDFGPFVAVVLNSGATTVEKQPAVDIVPRIFAAAAGPAIINAAQSVQQQSASSAAGFGEKGIAEATEEFHSDFLGLLRCYSRGAEVLAALGAGRHQAIQPGDLCGRTKPHQADPSGLEHRFEQDQDHGLGSFRRPLLTKKPMPSIPAEVKRLNTGAR